MRPVYVVCSPASKDHAAETKPRSLHAGHAGVIHARAAVPVAVAEVSFDQCQWIGMGQLAAPGGVVSGDDVGHTFSAWTQARYGDAHLLHGRHFVTQVLAGTGEGLNTVQGKYLFRFLRSQRQPFGILLAHELAAILGLLVAPGGKAARRPG